MAEKERPSFEEALKRLEDVVNQLEEESISLEKSIDLYEEGIKLSKICTETLEEAELRIQNVADQHTDDNEKE
jgi:exodeoxyribonuclease VII small subunit